MTRILLALLLCACGKSELPDYDACGKSAPVAAAPDYDAGADVLSVDEQAALMAQMYALKDYEDGKACAWILCPVDAGPNVVAANVNCQILDCPEGWQERAQDYTP